MTGRRRRGQLPRAKRRRARRGSERSRHRRACRSLGAKNPDFRAIFHTPNKIPQRHDRLRKRRPGGRKTCTTASALRLDGPRPRAVQGAVPQARRIHDGRRHRRGARPDLHVLVLLSPKARGALPWARAPNALTARYLTGASCDRLRQAVGKLDANGDGEISLEGAERPSPCPVYWPGTAPGLFRSLSSHSALRCVALVRITQRACGTLCAEFKDWWRAEGAGG